MVELARSSIIQTTLSKAILLVGLEIEFHPLTLWKPIKNLDMILRLNKAMSVNSLQSQFKMWGVEDESRPHLHFLQ